MRFPDWFATRCERSAKTSAALGQLYADYLAHCARGEAMGRDYFRNALARATPGGRWCLLRNVYPVRVGVRLVDGMRYPSADYLERTAHAGATAQRAHWRRMAES